MIKLLVPVFLFLCYQLMPEFREFLFIGFQFLREYDFYGLRNYLLSFGAAAPLFSIVLMILQSVVPFVPGVLMTITNAWLFGWLLGSIYSGVGALIGAVVDFYIARYYGKSCFEYIAGEKYVHLFDQYTARHGALSVFIARLIPVVPFKVISYSAGLSNLDMRTFALFTLLGQTPAIVLYSILGENIHDNLFLLVITTSCFCILAVFLLRWRK